MKKIFCNKCGGLTANHLESVKEKINLEEMKRESISDEIYDFAKPGDDIDLLGLKMRVVSYFFYPSTRIICKLKVKWIGENKTICRDMLDVYDIRYCCKNISNRPSFKKITKKGNNNDK